MTFLPQNKKQLSGFPQLSGEKLESLSIKAFQTFRPTFRAFRGKRRGTHRETPMKYELSGFPAFRPYGGTLIPESGSTPHGSPRFLSRIFHLLGSPIKQILPGWAGPKPNRWRIDPMNQTFSYKNFVKPILEEALAHYDKTLNPKDTASAEKELAQCRERLSCLFVTSSEGELAEVFREGDQDFIRSLVNMFFDETCTRPFSGGLSEGSPLDRLRTQAINYYLDELYPGFGERFAKRFGVRLSFVDYGRCFSIKCSEDIDVDFNRLAQVAGMEIGPFFEKFARNFTNIGGKIFISATGSDK